MLTLDKIKRPQLKVVLLIALTLRTMLPQITLLLTLAMEMLNNNLLEIILLQQPTSKLIHFQTPPKI